ncbi:MAG TPA: hypothetical protein VJQ77_05960 [Novosphingobium sp.]|nr:hypothetical protein [Novosphingobium sp.]
MTRVQASPRRTGIETWLDRRREQRQLRQRARAEADRSYVSAPRIVLTFPSIPLAGGMLGRLEPKITHAMRKVIS